MSSGPQALLSLVNPEWAPVVHGSSPISTPVLVHGVAVDSHVSLSDFPSTHRDFDQNTALRVDAADAALLAPGNALESGEPLLELEWELGAYPEWAWAGEGDRVVALGRWIFDCGHPDPLPAGTCAGSLRSCAFDSDCGGSTCAGAGGTCRGNARRCWVDGDCGPGGTCDGVQVRYWTEIHPPQAVAVIRTGGGDLLGGTPAPVTQADLFVSPDGGGAGDACVVEHRGSIEQFSAPCFPLSQPLALTPADHPPLATDLRFDLPLPAGGGGDPVWRVVDRQMPGGSAPDVPARLDVAPVSGGDAPHLAVTVRMSEAVGGRAPTGFAGTVIAGWTQAPPSDLAHARVTIEAVTVQDPSKAATTNPALAPPTGWRLHASVNGRWQQLPGLDTVDGTWAGQTLPVHGVTFDSYVPRSGALRLHAEGASFACANKLMGRPLSEDLVPFGGDLTTASQCLVDAPHDLGAVDETWPGPDFGTSVPEGTHVVTSAAGAYALTVRIELLTP